MKKICVIKAGSAVVTQKDGTLDLNIIQNICKEIGILINNGWKPILVSSGASSAGKGLLKEVNIDKAELRALSASIGQSSLISYYVNFLRVYAPTIQTGQILLTRENVIEYIGYSNLSVNISKMIECGILPIINENDVVSNKELSFTDNDQIASIIALMSNASAVILISEANGVYSKNPSIYNDAKRYSILPQDVTKWEIEINDSNVSNGGMTSKIDVFKCMAHMGINCALIGKESLYKDTLYKIITKDEKLSIGTILLCNSTTQYEKYKKWLLTAALPKAIVIVSDMGAKAISGENNDKYRTNLYLIGIEKYFGHFERGDIVSLRDHEFNLIGIGKAQYSSEELKDKKLRRQREESSVFIHDNNFVRFEKDFFVNRDKELVEKVHSKIKEDSFRIVNVRPCLIIDNQIKSNKKRSVKKFDFTESQTAEILKESRIASKKIGITHDIWRLFGAILGERDI